MGKRFKRYGSRTLSALLAAGMTIQTPTALLATELSEEMPETVSDFTVESDEPVPGTAENQTEFTDEQLQLLDYAGITAEEASAKSDKELSDEIVQNINQNPRFGSEDGIHIESKAILTEDMVTVTPEQTIKEDQGKPGFAAQDQEYKGSLDFDIDMNDLLEGPYGVFEAMMHLLSGSDDDIDYEERIKAWPIQGLGGGDPVVTIDVDLPDGYTCKDATPAFKSQFIKSATAEPTADGGARITVILDSKKKYGDLFESLKNDEAGNMTLSIPVEGKIKKGDSLAVEAKISGTSALTHLSRVGMLIFDVTIPEIKKTLITETTNSWEITKVSEGMELTGGLTVNGKEAVTLMDGEEFSLQATLDASTLAAKLDSYIKTLNLSDAELSGIKLADNTFSFQASFTCDEGIDPKNAAASLSGSDAFTVTNTEVEGQTVTVTFGAVEFPETLDGLKGLAESLTTLTLDLSGLRGSESVKSSKPQNITGSMTGTLESKVTYPEGGYYLVDYSFGLKENPSVKVTNQKATDVGAITVFVPTAVQAGEANSGEELVVSNKETFALTGNLDSDPIKDTMKKLIAQHGGASSNPGGIRVGNVDFTYQAEFTLPKGLTWDTAAKAEFTGSEDFEVKTAKRDGDKIVVTFGLKNSEEIHSLNDLNKIAERTSQYLNLKLNGFSLDQSAVNGQRFEIQGNVEGQLNCQIVSSSNALVNVTVKFKSKETPSAVVKALVVTANLNQEFKLGTSLKVNELDQADVKTGDTYSVSAALDGSPVKNRFDELLGQFKVTGEEAQALVKLENTDFAFTAEIIFPEGTQFDDYAATVKMPSQFVKTSETLNAENNKLTLTFGIKNLSTLKDLAEAMDELSDENAVSVTVSNLSVTNKMPENTWKTATVSAEGSFKSDVIFTQSNTLFKANLKFTADSAQAQIRRLEPINIGLNATVPAAVSVGDAEAGKQYRTEPGKEFALTGTIETSSIKKEFNDLVNSYPGLSGEPEKVKVEDMDLVFTARFNSPAGVILPQIITEKSVTLAGSDLFTVTGAVKDINGVTVTIGLDKSVKVESLADLVEMAANAGDTLSLTVPGCTITQNAYANQVFNITGTLEGKLQSSLKTRKGLSAKVTYLFKGAGENLKASVIATAPISTMKKDMVLKGSMLVENKDRFDAEVDKPFSMTSTLDVSEIAKLLNDQADDKKGFFDKAEDVEVKNTDFSFSAEYVFANGTDLSSVNVSLPEDCPFSASVDKTNSTDTKLVVTFALKKTPETLADLLQAAEDAGESITLTVDGIKATDKVKTNRNLEITGNVSGKLNAEIYFEEYTFFNAALTFKTEPVKAAYRVLETKDIVSKETIAAWIAPAEAEAGKTFKRCTGVPFALKGSIDTSKIRSAMDALVNAGGTSALNPAMIPVTSSDLTFTATFTLPEGMSWTESEEPSVLTGSSSFKVVKQEQKDSDVIVTLGLADTVKIENLKDLMDVAKDTEGTLELTVDGFAITEEAEAAKTYTVTGAVSGTFDAIAANGDGLPFHMVYNYTGAEDAEKGSLKTVIANVLPVPVSKTYTLTGSMDIEGQDKKDVKVGTDFNVISKLDVTEIKKVFDEKLGNQEHIFGSLSNAPISNTEFSFTAEYVFPEGVDLKDADASMEENGPFKVTDKKVEGNKLTATISMNEMPKTVGELRDIANAAGDELVLTISGVKAEDSIDKNKDLAITGSVEGILNADVIASKDTMIRPQLTFKMDQDAKTSIRVLKTEKLDISAGMPAWINVDGAASNAIARKRVNKPFALKGNISTDSIRQAMNGLINPGSTSANNPSAIPVENANLLITAEIDVPMGMSWDQDADVTLNAQMFEVKSKSFEGSKVTVTLGFKQGAKITSLKELIDIADPAITPPTIELTVDGFSITDEEPTAASVYEFKGKVDGTLTADVKTGNGIPYSITCTFNGADKSDTDTLSTKVKPVLPLSVYKAISVKGSMGINELESADLVAGEVFTLDSSLVVTDIKDTFISQLEKYKDLYANFSEAKLTDTEFGFTAVYTFPEGINLEDNEDLKVELKGDNGAFTVGDPEVDGKTLTVTFSMKEEPKTVADLVKIAEAVDSSLDLSISGLSFNNEVEKNTELTISGSVDGDLITNIDVKEDIILRPAISFEMEHDPQVTVRVLEPQDVKEDVEISSSISIGSSKPGEPLHVENGDQFTLSSNLDLSAAYKALDDCIESDQYNTHLTSPEMLFTAEFTLPDGVNWTGNAQSIRLSDDRFEAVSAAQEGSKVTVQIRLKDTDSIKSLEDLRDSLIVKSLSAAVDGFSINDANMSKDKTYTITSKMSGLIAGVVKDEKGLPYRLQFALTGEGSEDHLQAELKSVVTENVQQTYKLDGSMTIENAASFNTKTGGTFSVENTLNIKPAVDGLNSWIKANASSAAQPGENVQFSFNADVAFPAGTDLSKVKATLHGNSAFTVDSVKAEGNVLHVSVKLNKSVASVQDLQNVLNLTAESGQMRLRLSNLSATKDMKANTWQNITTTGSGSFSGLFQMSDALKQNLKVELKANSQSVKVRRQETINSGSTLKLDTSMSVNSGAAGAVPEVKAGDVITLNGLVSTARLKTQMDSLVKTHGTNAALSSSSMTFTAVFTLPSGMDWNGTKPQISGFKTVSAVKENGKVTVVFALDLSKNTTLASLKAAVDALPAQVKVALPDVKVKDKTEGQKLAGSFSVDGRLETHAVQADGTEAEIKVTSQGNTASQNLVTVKPAKKPDAPILPTVEKQAMYRLYNPNSGEHFYTSSEVERDAVDKAGWDYEGVGWYAPKSSKTPVYRLYNANAGDHHYTTEVNERDTLVSLGWKYEGIGWYSDDAKSVPVYRQYNPNAKAGAHNFTTSTEEHNKLVSLGWKGEGIAWYGVK